MKIKSGSGVLADRVILVCEDEIWISLDLSAEIESAGGRVQGPAASIKQGLSYLEVSAPDAAVVDVNLLDGESTPILLKLIELGVPTIVVTGRELPAEVADNDLKVFIKPVSPEYLVSVLTATLNH